MNNTIEKFTQTVCEIKLAVGEAQLYMDLTQSPNALSILSQLADEGYDVQIQAVNLSGIKLQAILLHELNISEARDHELADIFAKLTERFGKSMGYRRGVLQTPEKIYPLQYTVHDWAIPGTTVHTAKQGHLCPELEAPESGQTVVYVDYHKDLSDSLIQVDIELAIDAMGYPAGSRWIGRSPLDVDNVVSYVGTFPSDEVPQHLETLQNIVPSEVLVTRSAD